MSCGAIVLYCMNLPLEICFQSENVLILGLMPAPHKPGTWTIFHLLGILKDYLWKFENAQTIITSNHPAGIEVAARIYLTIADMEGSKLLTGFSSHAGKWFCTYCLCRNPEYLEDLDPSTWPPRTGEKVHEQAQRWKEAPLVGQRNELWRSNGVLWTPLHDFPHWNAVLCTIIGPMHCPVEGNLAFQLRNLYGLGQKKEDIKKIAEQEEAETFSMADTEEANSEVESLHSDHDFIMSDGDSPNGDLDENGDHTMASEDDIPVEDWDLDENFDEEEDLENSPYLGSRESFARQVKMWDVKFDDDDNDDDDDDDENDPDYKYIEVPGGTYKFNEAEVGAIRKCIVDIMHPSWVEKPPYNLGEARHGKLKAHQLHILFSVDLPTIVPEFWFEPEESNEVNEALLENFCNLVASVNLVTAYSTSNEEADLYNEYYTAYRASLKGLWPYANSRPNHHYAHHYPDQMRFWGPMGTLSEYPGERLNGELQRIPTNNHFVDMELTMIQQYSRKSKLNAKFHDPNMDDYAKQFADILKLEDMYGTRNPPRLMTEAEVATFLARAQPLDEKTEMKFYRNILAYLKKSSHSYTSAYTLPTPPRHSIILPSAFLRLNYFPIDGKLFHCKGSRETGSHIYYYIPYANGTTVTGCIESIWQVPLQQKIRTFFTVKVHGQLSAAQQKWNPYSRPPCSLLKVDLVLQALSSSLHIIEPQHIICHLAVRKFEKADYLKLYKHINTPVMAVVKSLDRGRRGP
ncbi:hypothetical protein BT96DRAFT_933145 [Gymnopus androsaceus JB14]|uniref:Uncharacterized protein n=1 Tax=Gymnopus androsaceus JB14 TaxID=1447944 RepID=A0A6A4IAS1_9AGAR|nr:hypothetical protein BT96DRAFT_933145 [Gymnopus androsaceus JB14]